MPTPASSVLKIADALVLQIRVLSRTEAEEVEVIRTAFRRFDAEETAGRKVYVIPVEDMTGGDGEDRGRGVTRHRFSIWVCERIPSEVVGFDDRDAWVDCRVDYVTMLRDALDEARNYDLTAGTTGANPVDGMTLVPLDSGVPRVVFDQDVLNELGAFVSNFELEIRES